MEDEKLPYLTIVIITIVSLGGLYLFSAIAAIVFAHYPVMSTLKIVGLLGGSEILVVMIIVWLSGQYKSRRRS